MSDNNLIRCLINAAEKASNIARICRANEELLSLLIQEKIGDEANSRFVQDFKTLADVLIQEMIKHDVGKMFPVLCSRIKGEESPLFTNTLGESVCITVGANATETANCLATVLHHHAHVAEVLATEVHRIVDYGADNLGNIPEIPEHLNYNNLGIWIDPIDATAEYISGNKDLSSFDGIPSTGLQCVTVLIGVYDCMTGEPIIGVISQPFHKFVTSWQSHIYWGISLNTLKANNCLLDPSSMDKRICILSSSESSLLVQQILNVGYNTTFAAGAGHKALKVITGEAELYILSKGSTFKWDTCAPQAILRSIGGNIFNFCESFRHKRPIPVNYIDANNEYSNKNIDGLIAVRNGALLEQLLKEPTIYKSLTDGTYFVEKAM